MNKKSRSQTAFSLKNHKRERDNMYNKVKLDNDLWAIDEGMVRCFLLHGEKGTLLIDSCMSGGDEFREVLNELTGGAPLTMTVTHTDRDHIGGFTAEDEVYVHPSEYEHLGSHSFRVKPLWDGDIFTAGNRTLKAKLLPGHTPGNIVFIDDSNKVIFIGDSISKAQVFMFGAGRNLDSFIDSLELLARDYADYSYYACHGEAKLPPSALTAQLECAKKLKRGELEGQPASFGGECKLYSSDGAGILY
jgi:glyoxylase-like metal-dependent hydrolase (beta-lactamase superfamily II)